MDKGRLRSFLVLLPIIAVLIALSWPAAAPAKGLSPHEEELARRIRFDRSVVLLVKEAGPEQVRRLIGYNNDGYQLLADGITVTVVQERVGGALSALRRRLAARGYQVFLVDENESTGTATIGVLRSADQYDILRVMQTKGAEYDVKNEDVIAKLKSWGNRSAFRISGAGYDWVEIEFLKLPADVKTFAQEAGDFCPNAADDEAGGLEGLVRELRRTRRLSLWWD